MLAVSGCLPRSLPFPLLHWNATKVKCAEAVCCLCRNYCSTVCVDEEFQSYTKGEKLQEHIPEKSKTVRVRCGERRTASVLDFKGDAAGTKRGIILIGQSLSFSLLHTAEEVISPHVFGLWRGCASKCSSLHKERKPANWLKHIDF